MKVLPELAKSVEFGGGGPRVFSVIMKISKKLTDEEYEAQLVPVIVRLFSSPDRALRVCLLENLPLMIDHLSQKLVSNNIFPQIVLGFSDVAPLVREQTVKSVLVIVPKLTDRVINGELLRHLAKTANDEQPGIRTNTTICLGKIAKNLGTGSRSKVLIAAFARGLRDPFVHARNAALMSFAATSEHYTDEDCATKILPGLCPSLIDKEKMVRDQANKTMDVFLARVRRHALTLPDTVLPPPTSGTSTPRLNQPPTMGSAPADGGASWTGWAISSFTNKLATVSGSMDTEAPNGSTTDQRSSSVPPAPSGSRLAPPKPLVNAVHTKSLTAKSGGQNPFKPTSVTVTPDPEEEEDFDASWGEAENAWGAGDDDVDPFAPKPSEKIAETVSFDVQGEPDFEGWLNAQSQGKAISKKPLPKGLSKTTRPALGSSASSGTTTTKRTALPSRTIVKKKEAPPPKAEEETDDWGDAWA
jgi:SCY1-like protein 1